MEVGMITRWGAPVVGREKEAVALFEETLEFGKKLLAEGKLTFFEPFLFTGGDMSTEQGFIVSKGPITEVFTTLESDEYRSLTARAELLLTHVHIEMLAVGEGVERQIADFRKAIAAVGF